MAERTNDTRSDTRWQVSAGANRGVGNQKTPGFPGLPNLSVLPKSAALSS
jgi:hypothetical protein